MASPSVMDTAKALPQGSPAIPLLEKNDTGRGVYISHIDRNPLEMKILLFTLILLIHIAFFMIMIWRASKNYHAVLALVLNNFYYVETGGSKRTKTGFWSWCWTFAVALFEYYFLSLRWPYFRKFVTGHLWFRLRYGFHEAEVFFRAPTGKAYDDMLKLPPAKVQQAWKMSLFQATDRQFLLENAGVNTCCRPWELCYAASIDAYRLAKDGVFNSTNWELSLWQKDENGRWTVYEVWRHQDPLLSAKGINIMKERLIAEGKESFVKKWEAILAQQPNIVAPLTNPATERLARSSRILFTAEGLDLGERWIEAITEAERIYNTRQLLR